MHINFTPFPLFTLVKILFMYRLTKKLMNPVMNTNVSYQWHDGSRASFCTVTAPGIYTVTLERNSDASKMHL